MKILMRALHMLVAIAALFGLQWIGLIDMPIQVEIAIFIVFSAFIIKKHHEMAVYFNRLERSQRDLDEIFDNVNATIWTYDTLKKKMTVSKGIEKLYGISQKEFDKDPMVWSRVVSEDSKQAIKGHVEKLFKGEGDHVVYKIQKPDGEQVWVKSDSKPIFDSRGNLVKLHGLVTDITDVKQAEHKIEHMAYYDSLTGLPNRNKLNSHFSKLLQDDPAKMQGASLVFLDLNRFKIINDTMGHDCGDEILRDTSKRLQSIIDDGHMVCRYGGDEFIILINDKNESRIRSIAQSVSREFGRPFIVKGNEFFVSASMGVSTFPNHGSDIGTLVKCAEIAMYNVKRTTRDGFMFYEHNQSDDVLRKLNIENELHRAIECNEIKVWYQPQYELATGRIVSIETLARWIHPQKGVIYPADFIPLAEETGQIILIGEHIMKEVCLQNKLWMDMGLVRVPVAVNVSAKQFQKDGFFEFVEKIINETGIEPELLEIEITETVMNDIKSLAGIIERLSHKGVQLALDDFGTGYSSLQLLNSLPINKLKIDKSFTEGIDCDVRAEYIIKAIVSLGESFELEVVAEGIETERQRDFLEKCGCRLGQGYLLARPLECEQMEELLMKSY